MRILHFSDIHLDVPIRDIPLPEWLGKRIIGGLNLLLYRRRKFENVWQHFDQLNEFRLQKNVDLVLCTGDYTLLGTEPRIGRITAMLFTDNVLTGLTIGTQAGLTGSCWVEF